MTATNSERVLVYPGSADDLHPLVLASGEYVSDIYSEVCDTIDGCSSASELFDVLRSVDRIVYFDILPYSGTGALNKTYYPTLDHFVKCTEVWLGQMVTESPAKITHHEDEKYFECEIHSGGFTGPSTGKKFEYHYGADFFAIDDKSHLSEMLKNANVLWEQAFQPGSTGDGPAPEYFSAFPNVDTVIYTLGGDMSRHHSKFEDNSVHKRGVRALQHPSDTRGVYESRLFEAPFFGAVRRGLKAAK